jgi:hypothetical protein
MTMSDETKKTDIKPAGKNVISSIVDEMAKNKSDAPTTAAPGQRLISGTGPQQSLLSDAPYKADLKTPAPSSETVKAKTDIAKMGPQTVGGISTGEIQKEEGKNIGEAIKSAVMMGMSDENSKVDIAPVDYKPAAISSGAVFSKDDKKGGGGGMAESMGGFDSIMKLFGDGGMAASDETGKSQVEGVTDERLGRFVDALKAYEYKYKDPNAPGAGSGKYVSPMAQDIEKTELGEGLVEDTPAGKMVNYGKAGGLMLATAAMMNDRMDELEAAFKNRSKKKGA